MWPFCVHTKYWNRYGPHYTVTLATTWKHITLINQKLRSNTHLAKVGVASSNLVSRSIFEGLQPLPFPPTIQVVAAFVDKIYESLPSYIKGVPKTRSLDAKPPLSRCVALVCAVRCALQKKCPSYPFSTASISNGHFNSERKNQQATACQHCDSTSSFDPPL